MIDMNVKINQEWLDLLKDEFEKEYFGQLAQFIRDEYISSTIYPPAKQIFSAFDYCSPSNLKVVILGQDPYHGSGQANGLSFSVNNTVSAPPSLRNIFKELKNDLGIERKTNDLSDWAKQGVLLLNATLTVKKAAPMSHQGKGWETFTDAVISKISDTKQSVVFILWGKYARDKKILIDTSKHYVIESPHPSPFSADKGFFGSKPFSKTNIYLSKQGKQPINW